MLFMFDVEYSNELSKHALVHIPLICIMDVLNLSCTYVQLTASRTMNYDDAFTLEQVRMVCMRSLA